MFTQRQKLLLRAVLISLVGGAICASGLWLYSRYLASSSRLRVMEPHLKSYPVTLPQLKHVAEENQIPFEIDDRGNGVFYASVPLDGSRTGQRLWLEFFQSGELRAAFVEKESGEIDHWLYHVRK